MGGIIRTVGQYAAFALGNALGGPLGGAIANTLFNVLVPPPKPSVGSTKLDDLMREGAEIGTAIKTFYGVMPTKGDVIDCGVDKNGVPAGIQEVVKKTKQKGATGGGSAPTSEEHTYFLTSMFLLGTGPLFVEQIKENNADGEKVVYDRYNELTTGTKSNPRNDWFSQKTAGTALGNVLSGAVAHNGGKALNDGKSFALTPQYSGGELVAELSQKLRFYLGTERQPIDTVLAQIHGNRAVAYTGCACVMFNRWKINGASSYTFIVRDLETGRRRIIRKRLMACGVPQNRIALNSIDGNLHGAVITQVEPVRDMIEKIAATRFHDLHFINGGYHDVSRANPYQWTLSASQLGARVVADGSDAKTDTEAPARAHINHKAPRELPTILRVRFVDPDLNYESNEAVAQRAGADHENETTVEVPFAARLDEMVWFADTVLDELWAANGSERFSILPKLAQIAPGNVINFPYKGRLRTVRVTSQGLAPRGLLEQTAVPYDGGVYGQHRIVSLPDNAPIQIADFGAPLVFLGDLPAFDQTMRDGAGFVWGAASPIGTNWGGALLQSDAVTGFGSQTAEAQATVGELKTAYSYTDLDVTRLDTTTVLRVQILGGGVLTSGVASDVEAGGNVLALGEMLLSYLTAVPVAGQPNTYDLTGLLPGRFGTDWIKTVAIGTRFLKVTETSGELASGFNFVSVPTGKLLTPRALKVVSASDDTQSSGNLSFSVSGNSLKPPRILQLFKESDGALGYNIVAFPRSRNFSARYFDNGIQTPESDPRRVTVVLKNGATVVDTRVVDSVTIPIRINYTQAQLQGWFGGTVPATLSGSIWHEGALMKGQERTFTI